MDSERRMPRVKDIWRLALAIIGVVAIIQELRKPPDERTWHGKVADFVPYDFRMPTIGRVRSTYWNPEGPILPGKVFGVGWAVNFGVLTRMLGKWRAREDSNAQPSDPKSDNVLSKGSRGSLATPSHLLHINGCLWAAVSGHLACRRLFQ